MRYLILGAGPAGLTFANKLLQDGETSFLVLEKESEAGGLCRSANVDGSPIDFGGGHFLDVKNTYVNKFLFQFMPEEEWNIYERDSKISINDNIINYPIEANIWQMKAEDQVEYLKSIAAAGCNLGNPKPEKFVSWIYWKLGSKIAEDYMIPYNQKVFSKELNELGTYWLEKLPSVQFEETLLSCLEKKAYGIQPGHAQFYYPKKYGYGELWIRMSEKIKKNIKYNVDIKEIDFKTRTVNGKYSAENIITTIPWNEFTKLGEMPSHLKNNIKMLKYTSIQIEYHPEELDTKAQWIYCPNPDLSYHRILVRHNFCPGSRGYWTETNEERVVHNADSYSYINKYAYPLNTIKKPAIINEILEWAKAYNVFGLGRWGEWQHYNSDVTVDLAMKLYNKLEQELY